MFGPSDSVFGTCKHCHILYLHKIIIIIIGRGSVGFLMCFKEVSSAAFI